MLCRAVKFGQVFPLYLSSFVLTLMAVDRAVGITGGGGGWSGVSGVSSRGAASSAIAIGKVDFLLHIVVHTCTAYV